MAGVCNYNLANSIAVKKRFLEDKYFMFNAEVKPYFDLLEPLDKKAYYKYMDRWMNRVYIMECSYKYCSKKEKLHMILRDPRVLKWIIQENISKFLCIIEEHSRQKILLLICANVSIISHLLLMNQERTIYRVISLVLFLIALFIFWILTTRIVYIISKKILKK